ncbi:MAG: PH domain-containing protein [Erysipelotrichia bacterium]|jgi:hypothetical protein|nr:PH domain-containing protein [Erysipelotrichia bacterium]
MRHYSKIDLWIQCVIWGTVLVSIFPLWVVEPHEQWIVLMILVPTALLMLLLLYNTYYVFEEEYLKCVVGFYVQKIRYENIKSLKKTRNFLSSAALSADRIEIKEKNKGYIMGTTYISPKNKDEFFEELRQYCPKDVEVLK